MFLPIASTMRSSTISNNERINGHCCKRSYTAGLSTVTLRFIYYAWKVTGYDRVTFDFIISEYNSLVFLSPLPLNSLHQLKQRCGYWGEILHEASITCTNANKGTHLCKMIRRRPSFNGFQLISLHGTKELNLSLEQGPLTRLQLETGLGNTIKDFTRNFPCVRMT